MAFDQYAADRIYRILEERKVSFYTKKMMGGLLFMVNDKMCIGLDKDKETNQDRLMCRIGEEAFSSAINKTGARKMDFTGRPMKGYIFVNAEGWDKENDLEYWVDLALAFNPFAKASKKKK